MSRAVRTLLLGALSLQFSVHRSESAGGIVDMPVSEVPQDITMFALGKVEAGSNFPHKREIIQITHAQRQVVAGIRYILTLELGARKCESDAKDDKCPVIEDESHESCVVDIWEKKWENFTEAMNISCQRFQSQRPKRDSFIPGRVQLHREVFRELKEETKEQMLGQDGHDQKHHGKMMLGGGGHDQMPHGRILGGDGHDQMPHGRILGQDGHDQRHHFGEDRDENPHFERDAMEKAMERLSGDDKGFMKLKGDRQSLLALKKLQSPRHFKQFVKKFDKQYESVEEYKKRFGIFRENMKKVQFLRETERGTGVYGATKFADLSEDEFRLQALGLKLQDDDPTDDLPPADIPDVKLPKEFDWRKYKAVTPVKNQGSCGSCWAFSVTGNIEGQWALRRGKLLELSEQELVDCDKIDDGCEGGLPANAYKVIKEMGGLETEAEYAYEGVNDKCAFNKSEVEATISGAVKISKNETQMALWLFKNGPISIGINANAMQFYFGGVSHPFKFLCSPESLDHGVLIVGFGVHTYPLFHRVMPFWIVKNSWGTGWGEEGYYRVYRGDGTCGVNQMATSALV